MRLFVALLYAATAALVGHGWVLYRDSVRANAGRFAPVTALSSASPIEPRVGSRPSGLQSTFAGEHQ